jgi:hypothetical protein
LIACAFQAAGIKFIVETAAARVCDCESGNQKGLSIADA